MQSLNLRIAMGTKTIEKQLQDLTQQVVLLRSLVIGVIIEKDPEGAEGKAHFCIRRKRLAP